MKKLIALWRTLLQPRPLPGPIMVATFKDTPRKDRPAFLDAMRRHPGLEA